MLTIILAIIVFILGLYFIFNSSLIETFDTSVYNYRCPNVLIQKGNEFILYNKRLAKVPGVNPLRFNSLQEYVEFMEWQIAQGIKCPILYLQHSYDAQGNSVYKAHQDPINPNGGLPNMEINNINEIKDPANTITGESLLLDANVDDPPFNSDVFPAYDRDNQYIGLDTPLDKLYSEDSTILPSLANKTNNEGIYSQEHAEMKDLFPNP